MASATWENASVAGGYNAAEKPSPWLASNPLLRWLRRTSPRLWRRLPALARAGVCVTIAGAGAFAIATSAGASVPIVAGVLALLCSGMLAGWSVGLDARGELEREINDRSHELWHALSELEVAQAETVRRLSMAVEFRDEDTGAHIERIGRLSARLAEHIGLDPAFCSRLNHAAPLHDVGKVAIPDAILLKPGPLTPAERAIVETHAEEGHRLLCRSSSSILDLAASIALSHHEKWDGTGYPRGLTNEEIPIEGRIVAVTDVFDALTSDRVYRKAFAAEKAVEMMKEQRGMHFDAEVLDAFMDLIGASESSAATVAQSAHATGPLLECFTQALERGDAEMAEEAVAQALEEGMKPATLHTELIAPSMRTLDASRESGDIDVDAERRATSIARRILATVYRSMINGSEPSRERVLLAGVEGDWHTLGLQMAHDQLVAGGFRATLVSDVSPERLTATIENQEPDVFILGGIASSVAPAMQRLLSDMRERYPELPVVIGGSAASHIRSDRGGVLVLEHIEQCVTTVEHVLAGRRDARARMIRA